MTEDEVKKYVKTWLENEGWTVEVKWGRKKGVDITASRRDEIWIIEAKSSGSRPPMYNNYFLAILGELLQRMADPKSIYSIALPAEKKFICLWEELPCEAKRRLGIKALFVDSNGGVSLSEHENSPAAAIA